MQKADARLEPRVGGRHHGWMNRSSLLAALLVAGGLMAFEITVTPSVAEGCSGSGLGPSGHGGEKPCEEEAVVDIEPLYNPIPADGVLFYRYVKGMVACNQAPKASSFQVLGPDGANVAGEFYFPSPPLQALSWKPAEPFQPNQTYRMVAQLGSDAPREHTFQTGGPAPLPVASLQLQTFPPSLIEGEQLVTCQWTRQSYVPGDCTTSPYVSSSSVVSRKERVTVEATWSLPPSFPEIFEYRLLWDGHPSEAPTPPEHSYTFWQTSGSAGLSGKCLSLRIRNPVTGAESTSEPQCVTLPALKPDTVDCDTLARVIEQCGQAGAPNSGHATGAGKVVSDVSGFRAQCPTVNLGEKPSSGGGCALGAHGSEGWWLLVLAQLGWRAWARTTAGSICGGQVVRRGQRGVRRRSVGLPLVRGRGAAAGGRRSGGEARLGVQR